jgi:hypothetical protein
MMRALILLLPLLAVPANATTLESLQGQWRGEGALTLGSEPEQRLRCQIRLSPQRGGEVFFVGRCATAQGSQSFTYLLRETADGLVEAENRAEGETDLPARMEGRAEPGLVRFQAETGALFELRRVGESLRLIIAGQDARGPSRGEALLTLRE